MSAEGMPLPGGIDRQEAEFALDTLQRADVILSQPKLLEAINKVAEQRKNLLDDFSPESVLKKNASRQN